MRAIRSNLPPSLGVDTEAPGYVQAYEDAGSSAHVIVGLVRRRCELGLTQQDVATRMGTTQSAVSRMECSTADPHVSTLQRYARAVGWRLDLSAGPPDPATDEDAPRPAAGSTREDAVPG